MTALELEKLKAILASKAQPPTAEDPSLNIPDAPAPDAGALVPSPLPPPMAEFDPTPASPPAPAPAVRVNPDLERAKAALMAAQAPTAKPTWQQQVADKLGGFARYGAMDPVHAQGLEQQRLQTDVENKRNKTQDLVARLKMIQDEDYRQQELERQNKLAAATQSNYESEAADRKAKEEQAAINERKPKTGFAPAGTQPGSWSEQGVWTPQGAPVPKETTPKSPGYRDRIDAKTGNTIRDYFDESNPSAVTSSADLGQKKPDTANQNQQRGDRSFNSRSAELDKVGQPVSDSLQRLGRLFDTIDNGSPLADSVTAPELMVVMAGGAGSGVRITTAEINSIIGSQSKWEQAKAAIKQWSTNPAEANRILEPMRGQIRGLLMKVHEKQVAKEQIIEESRQKLIDSDDPKEHRQIIADTKRALAAIDEGKQQTAAPVSKGGGSWKVERVD